MEFIWLYLIVVHVLLDNEVIHVQKATLSYGLVFLSVLFAISPSTLFYKVFIGSTFNRSARSFCKKRNIYKKGHERLAIDFLFDIYEFVVVLKGAQWTRQ